MESLDIRDNSNTDKVLEWINSDPTLKYIRRKYTSIQIADRFGHDLRKRGFLSEESQRDLKEKEEIIVALAPILMGASSLFYFLKKEGYRLKIENSFQHSAYIIKQVSDGDISPDIIVGGDGMTVEFYNSNLNDSYELWMVLHYFDISVIAPALEHGLIDNRSNFKGNFYLPNENYNGLSVTKNRIHSLSSTLLKDISENNQQPDQALTMLYSQPDPENRHLVYSLHAGLAQNMGLGKKIVISGISDAMRIPVVVLAKKSFTQSNKGKDFYASIHHSHKILKGDELEREKTIDFMLSDENYVSAMGIISGLEDLFLINLRVKSSKIQAS